MSYQCLKGRWTNPPRWTLTSTERWGAAPRAPSCHVVWLSLVPCGPASAGTDQANTLVHHERLPPMPAAGRVRRGVVLRRERATPPSTKESELRGDARLLATSPPLALEAAPPVECPISAVVEWFLRLARATARARVAPLGQWHHCLLHPPCPMGPPTGVAPVWQTGAGVALQDAAARRHHRMLWERQGAQK